MDTYDYWYRQDIRGSVTNIISEADSVVKSYTYEAYGNTSSTGTFTNSFAYTGAITDTETGLYYMNARYYDPETGRFISQDSYRGEAESFWHLYLYCNSDPVNNTDPSGHVTIKFKVYAKNSQIDKYTNILGLIGGISDVIRLCMVAAGISVTGIGAIVVGLVAAGVALSIPYINLQKGKFQEIFPALSFFTDLNILYPKMSAIKSES